MRFYPTGDIDFYVDISDGWDRYCRWPNKSWKYVDLSPTKTINYWRDLEGAQKAKIKNVDLFFDKWPRTRIRPQACLPIYYSTGNRFIQVSKAEPAGFKCAPLSMNLAEVKAKKKKLRAEAKAQKKLAKLKKEQEKLEKLKRKNKSKK